MLVQGNAFPHSIVCMQAGGAVGVGGRWPVVVWRVWLVAMPSKLYTTDAYELLGLARGQEYGHRDVTKAYRRLSRKVHPDKAGGDRVRLLPITREGNAIAQHMHYSAVGAKRKGPRDSKPTI